MFRLLLSRFVLVINSQRTKAALAAAKARGKRLGCPNGIAPLVEAGKGNVASVAKIKANADKRAQDLAGTLADVRAHGATSLRIVAAELNRRGIKTARGGRWHAASVKRLEGRVAQ
jgi:hypothetical protein